jgi:putative copper resistance protein D
LIWLLRDFDLLSVLLRALTLGLEMLTLGGVAYLLLAAIPGAAGEAGLSACWRGLRWAAIGLALTEIAYVAVDSAILMGSSALHLGELVFAPFFLAGVAAAIGATAIAVCTRFTGRWSRYLLVPCGLVVLAAVVSTSHSVSRMEDRVVLAGLTAAHQLGASVWIGAMPFLLISLKRVADADEAKRLLRRFTPMAIAGAGTLLVGGVGMAWFYLGISADKSLSGLYGTAYGVMMLSKVYLVLVVMAMGAGNYFLGRRIETAPLQLLARLRRFGEAEIGLGFMAVLAAASMTSQPPAADMPHDRVSIAEIVARFHPIVPRMTSPGFAELAPSTPLNVAVKETQFSGANAPSDANDEAWSEYNHHWAGVIVLAAGFFALLSRLPSKYGLSFGWARNWPVTFAGLAVFLVLRADPDCWPLGPRPFWASMYAPDVLQHRLYALLILAFAAFEWGIQTGRLHSRWAAAVFPLLCAAGGALLLTHNHSIGNVKEELLAEMSHTPIALLGATAGWSRWLELRLPDQKESRFASYVWPVCLILVGLVLLNYRES